MPNFSEDILVEIPENEVIESCAVIARELPITYYVRIEYIPTYFAMDITIIRGLED